MSKHLSFPAGTSSDDLSLPDAAYLDLADGDSLRITFSQGSYNAIGGNQEIAGRALSWYMIWINGSPGFPQFAAHDGTTYRGFNILNATTGWGWVDGTVYTLRIDFSVSGSDWNVNAYRSTDGGAWDGPYLFTITPASTTVNDASQPFRAPYTIAPHTSLQFYSAEHLDSGGTQRWGLDATNLTAAEVEAAEFTEDANGATVTLNGDSWTYVNPVTSGILSRAELLLQMGDGYSHVAPMWADRSGNNHHGQWGSAGGSDTNDPVRFGKGSDGKYVWIPQAADYLSVPDSSALDISSTLDIRWRGATDVPTGTQYLFDRFRGAGARHWRLSAYAGGEVRITASADGTVGIDSSLTSSGFIDGDLHDYRYTIDFSDGSWAAYKDDVLFDSATDAALAITPFTGGSAEVGLYGRLEGTATPTGTLYECQIYADGVLVLDVNLNDATEPFATFTERANGATVTINRSASGYVSTVVDRAMAVFSTDDYVRVADDDALDFGASDDFTLVSVVSLSQLTALATYAIAGKGNNINAVGWYQHIYDGAPRGLRIHDGAVGVQDALSNVVVRQRYVIAGRRDTTADEVEAFSDGVSSGSPTSDTTTASLSNASGVTIGRHDAGTGYFEGEIMAVALFREALTDEEILQVSNILAGTGGNVVSYAGPGELLYLG